MTTGNRKLREAFSGESQVNCLYLALARQAEEEGHREAEPSLARARRFSRQADAGADLRPT
jgi:rubrerythrin